MSNAITEIQGIIDRNQLKEDDFTHFVLQGGAGSGKTESLKEIIAYVASNYPDKKIACITHTNVAVDELIARVGNRYEISTIHSFLNKLIKNYRSNIKEVIGGIFYIKHVSSPGHEEYKKVYTKYAKKLFAITGKVLPKVTGKRDYDREPETFNQRLRNDVDALNGKIAEIIAQKDHRIIAYNESRFDSLEELGFSHDSLLTIACALCERFPLLPQIISDKYDFIFIDEYQDSSAEVVRIFLELLPANRRTTVGLFGDSMQGIYEDGIGDVEHFVGANVLKKVEKEDNFRCSYGVVDFINVLRNDGITQKVALKSAETPTQRAGGVKFYYRKFGAKPNAFSPLVDKNEYATSLNGLIEEAKKLFNKPDAKILMLTNKSISTEVGFEHLYKVFNDRYSEVKEEIEKELSRIQVSELAGLCRAFESKEYNALMGLLKKNGFMIRSVKDKTCISAHFEYLLGSDLSMAGALSYALNNKLIRKSERHRNYLREREVMLIELESDKQFKMLEGYYLAGSNTRVRLEKDRRVVLSDEEFDAFESMLKKKNFAEALLSQEIPFKEVLNYYRYLNEETGYITMHKTKGSGIGNVIAVLDEYLWNMYNFKSIYDSSMDGQIRIKNQKLFYVACSRAISNLAVVRMVQDDNELALLKGYFQYCEFLPL
ncbi:ATP-dependent helicase [Pedobacter sp. MR2016-19]|uniref:UvrD-helicase domain-containing protein n=1 Tax=Pedobacter sp. MR2016-19 TaxID=2780089 RepID=UPI001874656A|nr:UvrD-helicase domain-containing protein [Pedobacter sp. MR2016-19]MBE5320842.1 ATP-dependent helicase [Pedobacter sp. MR2016-19]